MQSAPTAGNWRTKKKTGRKARSKGDCVPTWGA